MSSDERLLHEVSSRHAGALPRLREVIDAAVRHLHGRYEFRSVRPVPSPIPRDGPVGRLLGALGRDTMRPGHVHLKVSAPGYRTVVTHVSDAASDHLDDDVVLR